MSTGSNSGVVRFGRPQHGYRLGHDERDSQQWLRHQHGGQRADEFTEPTIGT